MAMRHLLVSLALFFATMAPAVGQNGAFQGLTLGMTEPAFREALERIGLRVASFSGRPHYRNIVASSTGRRCEHYSAEHWRYSRPGGEGRER